MIESKQSDIQTTPHWLKLHFEKHFDPCPIDPKFNGLEISWRSPAFVNPPYSNVVKDWIKKALHEREREVFLL